MRTPSRTTTSARPTALEAVTVATAEPVRPVVPWWLAAIGGPILAAGAGWAITAALAVWGELAATGSVTSGALELATSFWLLAHGGPAVIGGLTVTLMPLLLTAVQVLLLHAAAAFAARQALPAGDLEEPVRRRLTLKVAGVVAAAYTAAVGGTACATDFYGPGVWAVLGAVILGAGTGLVGVRAVTGWVPPASVPDWAKAIPRAAGAAVVVLLLGGVAALLAGLVAHRELIAAWTAQLQPGVSGAILLALLQAFYLPDLVVWAAVWTTGAGFSLGGDSVVVLVGQTVEVLPSFPIAGALPANPAASWWNLLWLAWGVAAGGLAAWLVVRARPRARFDETALVGGLAGVGAGAVFWALAMLTRGNLGDERLVGLGPLPLATAVLACTVMGFAGVFTGLVLGLLRSPGRAPAAVTEQVARTVTLWAGAAGDDDGASLIETTRGVERVHFGPHNVVEAYEEPTGGLDDLGPTPADSGPIDLVERADDATVAMPAPFSPASPESDQPPLDFG
jgi:hypothetical protein